jgi:hypothetical protein
MLLVHNERRGGYAIGGKSGGGAGWRIGHNQGKVSAATGFKASPDGAEAEAARK